MKSQKDLWTQLRRLKQNEEIRQNNDKLTKQNRLLVSTANALTEENEYLRNVLKQHDIELDPAPASEQKQ